ncbi:MAG: hypothetical protein VB084_05815 [Syntrophomonadaceae bacterium]|nr:hypothetical protein [Syntrophomonadaceae bacterium]
MQDAGIDRHPQTVSEMPWEYAKILKLLPHSVTVSRSRDGVWFLEDGASYQIAYYPNVREFDLSVAASDNTKLNDVKSILTVFFPNSYEEAYQYLREVKQGKEVNLVLDKRAFATECYIDEGIMIIGLEP